jgi:pimeloyl-ACP methyl ester carboxylesterase
VKHDYAQIGDVRLHYAECGAGDELVILLHGFPECWYSWRHQLPVLGERFYVVAPDMRGFNLSDKPGRVEDYQINRLVDDVLGLIKHFGKEKATGIVAHDWGAAVGWALAQRHPEALGKLAALQVPMAGAWRANMTLAQLRRSWYMFFFQLPRVPEWWMGANDFQRVTEMYRTTAVRSDAFTNEDLDVYREALRQPGALTASLNYYRANVFRSLKRGGVETPKDVDGRIKVPVLFIYGEQDMAVLPSTVRDLGRFIDASYREIRIPNSGHWVQNEAVSEVNDALLDFLNDDSHAIEQVKREMRHD